jgi:hypothetical protein
MEEQKDIEKLINKVKLGKASQDTQIWLTTWLQAESEIVWNEFLNTEPKLEKFLEIQAKARQIRRLLRSLVLSQSEGKDAGFKLQQEYNLTLNKDK